MREKGQKLPVVKKEARPEEKKEEPEIEEKKEEKKEETKHEERKEEPKTEDKKEVKEEASKSEEKNEDKEKTDKSVEDAFKSFSKNPDEIKNDEKEIKKKELLEKKAPEGRTFKLEGGEELSSLQDLLNTIDKMPDNIFSNHVNNDKNDFAEWTRYVFDSNDVADRMKNAKTKNELKEVLINVG